MALPIIIISCLALALVRNARRAPGHILGASEPAPTSSAEQLRVAKNTALFVENSAPFVEVRDYVLR